MKRKAEIQKAYDESVKEFQELKILEDPKAHRCAGYQEALLWVLGRGTYRPYKKKEDSNGRKKPIEFNI
tara:strand:+ start:132 stop:338 length:207 start_codon:yes stop_codon:yes gene_type:complete